VSSALGKGIVIGRSNLAVISGNPVVGQTLTASAASSRFTVTGYQWTRDGVDISGATASTRVLTSSDSGHTIACKLTGVYAARGKSLPISATQYTGLVATRARTLNTKNVSFGEALSRSAHVATTDISALQLVFQNFQIQSTSGGLETGSGQPATVEASIEYPAGVCTRVKFGGSNQGSMPAVSASGATSEVGVVFSDLTSISIPNGATFWIRQLFKSPTGGAGFWHGVRDSALGDILNIAGVGTYASNHPYIDGTGSLTHNGATNYLPPLAIIGPTNSASIIMAGDSIMYGQGDTAVADSRYGLIAHAMPTTTPFLNLSLPGEKATGFLTHAPGRSQLFPYCSHMVTNLAINDFGASDTPANVAAALTALAAAFPSRVTKYLCTVTPRDTTTDSFATLANQTPLTKASRDTHNANIRGGLISGYAGYFETEGPMVDGGAGASTGKWIVNGTANYPTTDGLHPTTALYALLASSGNIDMAKFAYP
jgi:hypothetical protein